MDKMVARYSVDTITVSDAETGMRIQLRYLAESEAETETIDVSVVLKRANLTIRELREKALRRSIELLQQYIEAADAPENRSDKT